MDDAVNTHRFPVLLKLGEQRRICIARIGSRAIAEWNSTFQRSVAFDQTDSSPLPPTFSQFSFRLITTTITAYKFAKFSRTRGSRREGKQRRDSFDRLPDEPFFPFAPSPISSSLSRRICLLSLGRFFSLFLSLFFSVWNEVISTGRNQNPLSVFSLDSAFKTRSLSLFLELLDRVNRVSFSLPFWKAEFARMCWKFWKR